MPLEISYFKLIIILMLILFQNFLVMFFIVLRSQGGKEENEWQGNGRWLSEIHLIHGEYISFISDKCIRICLDVQTVGGTSIRHITRRHPVNGPDNGCYCFCNIINGNMLGRTVLIYQLCCILVSAFEKETFEFLVSYSY